VFVLPPSSKNSCDNGILGYIGICLVPADKGLAAYFGIGRHIGRTAVFNLLNDLFIADDDSKRYVLCLGRSVQAFLQMSLLVVSAGFAVVVVVCCGGCVAAGADVVLLGRVISWLGTSVTRPDVVVSMGSAVCMISELVTVVSSISSLPETLE